MSNMQDTNEVDYEPFDPSELVQAAQPDAADENVETFTGKRDPMAILGGLRELLSKYQYMNEQLMSQRRSIKRKLPDIQQAKETVTYLKKQKEGGVGEYRCRFPLTDNAHASAKINPQEVDSVCLWLGANILLEYKLDEASTNRLSWSSGLILVL
ncbi:Prefoldin subunit 3 [Perkinsus chesapeaki]|uniref:Prefoldin subunit 3 n=1 Tax=Perkinsus chesapeaki TaxID=330153 RepID=A0A7J6MH39_PERCH|nr:Prefoldin subunit 3 [Perkinsus chesapeaki]